MLRKGALLAERYVIDDYIDAGGLAEVWRAHHAELGTTYAIKVVHATRSGIAQRLLIEGRIQAQLRHPNIVEVRDVVRDDDVVGLVMELIEGETLENLLSRQGRLSQAEALEVFAGVTAAVLAAHRVEVLHRDLKPGNVLLPEREGLTLPKVVDFGIAKVVWEGRDANQTLTGAPMGTPGYLAPEQVLDASDVGPEADVFALGVLLYRMLTGTLPYTEADGTTRLSSTVTGVYTPLAQRLPECPEPLRAAVEQALHRDRSARTATVGELGQAVLPPARWERVQESLAGSPATLRPPSAANPVDATNVRHTLMPEDLDEVEPPVDATDVGHTLMPADLDEEPPAAARGGRFAALAVLAGVGLAATGWWLLREPPPVSESPEASTVQTAPTPSPPAAEPTETSPAPILSEASDESDKADDDLRPSDASTAPPLVAAPSEAVVEEDAEPPPAPDAPPPEEDPVPSDALPDDTPPPVEPEAEEAEGDDAPAVADVEPAPEEPPTPTVTPGAALLGSWTGSAGGRPMTMELRSADDGRVEGEVTFIAGTTGRTLPVSGSVGADGTLRLSDATGDTTFTGRASGDRVAGTCRFGKRGKEQSWDISRAP